MLDEGEDERSELEMEYDLILSKIKDVDENQYFKQVIFMLRHKNSEFLEKVISELSQTQGEFLRRLLQTQTINIESNGENRAVHRRIIKARRRINQ